MTQNQSQNGSKIGSKSVQRPKKTIPKKAGENDAQISKKSSENGPQDAPTGRQERPLSEHLGSPGLPKRLPEGRLAPSRTPRIRYRPPEVGQEPPQDARRPKFHDFSSFSFFFKEKSIIFTVLRCFALLCFALQCFALICVAFNCCALLSILWHCFAFICVVLHCLALLCIPLLCVTLH